MAVKAWTPLCCLQSSASPWASHLLLQHQPELFSLIASLQVSFTFFIFSSRRDSSHPTLAFSLAVCPPEFAHILHITTFPTVKKADSPQNPTLSLLHTTPHLNTLPPGSVCVSHVRLCDSVPASYTLASLARATTY